MYKSAYQKLDKMSETLVSAQEDEQRKSKRKQEQAALVSRIGSRVPEAAEESIDRVMAGYIASMRQRAKEEGPKVEGGSVTGMAKPDNELSEGVTRPKNYGDVVYENTKLEDNEVDYRALAVGLKESADALGMDVEDLATIVSYETGGTFNPTKAGPTTKWGQHKGLIQFGEVQAKEYGVDWNNPYDSQLGPDGAIVRYFKDRGYKEGMGLLDAYSIVNAGSPGLYDRSDESAGGAPGTVKDKVTRQMSGHKAKARRLIEEYLM